MTSIFVCENGTKIKYGPIDIDLLIESQAGVEKKFRSLGHLLDEPNVPTYDVKLAGGGIEPGFLYDDKYITEGSEEEVERKTKVWDKYQADLKKYTSDRKEMLKENTDIVMEIVLVDGVLNEVDKNWVAKCERRYIELPSDSDKLKIKWLFHVLINKNDALGLIENIMRASVEVRGADEGTVEQLVTMFRNSIPSYGGSTTKKSDGLESESGTVEI